MSQVSNLNLVTNIERVNEHFLLRVTRKVQHDATIQIDNVLYETDSIFAGKRVEIRYEPEWINDITKALPIYDNGKKVGEASVVRFYDNSHVKRRFKGNRRKDISPEDTGEIDTPKRNTISYYDIESEG
jgi:hypothetical protein